MHSLRVPATKWFVFGWLVISAVCPAPAAEWYDESFIHTHVSLNLPVEHLAFIRQQITEVQPDAIQFHTHDLRLLKRIKADKMDEELGFKTVATINHAGVWYAHYDDDPRYVLRVNADGTFAGRWNRKHLCFNAPVVYDTIIPDKYVGIPREIRPAQVWIDESIITVNVCYCRYCVAGYEERHGHAPPRALTDENFAEWEQWVAFHRETFVAWMRAVIDAVHSVDPDILVTINHAYFVEQPEPLPDFIENLSGDIHKDPLELGLYAKYAASINAPFDLMPGLGRDVWAGVQPKTAEQVCHDVAQIVAYGGRWNIGEFPTDFLTLRNEEKYRGPGYRRADLYLDLAQQGARFARQRQEFCMGKRTVPYAVILHSARTHYAHVIFNTNRVNDEGAYGMTSDGILSRSDTGRINSRIYWPNNIPIAEDLVGAYEALVENHVQFDLVHADHFRRNRDAYRLLVLAEQAYLEDETAEAIRAFVRRGGAVIASGSSIQAGLEDVFGVHPEALSEPARPTAELAGDPWVAHPFTVVRPEGATVVQQTTAPAYPLVTVHDYGAGKAIYVAAHIFGEYYRRSGYSYHPSGDDAATRRFVADLLALALPATEQTIQVDAPPWWEVNLMQDDTSVYVHVLNRRLHWKQPAGDDTAIQIAFPLAHRPAEAKLQPGGEPCRFEYRGGRVLLQLEPDQVGIHRVIQVTK